eukprot:CAMPEP_0118921222 /NCGR_PEP_ID=MMETSP1169-20130426/571_1 /TAXON_ID=36882 /ORGANISM="Pyramimonas obovata, Strain CCMP722" /LENGTH=55 /DNA_ID=CAMNT_0006861909 /DNA_START=143 /DNA_END=307 /DNA_ORIENTATION=-
MVTDELLVPNRNHHNDENPSVAAYEPSREEVPFLMRVDGGWTKQRCRGRQPGRWW